MCARGTGSTCGNMRASIMDVHSNSMDTNNSDFDEEDCDHTRENDKNEDELTLDDVLRSGGTKVSFFACLLHT